MSLKNKSIVVLTGAGISAESGIRTFRAADGLWEDHAIEDVASPEGFERNPDLVQEFYNQRRRQLADVAIQPNKAHHALAELEKNWAGEFLLVTQNVDDLHDRAGSKNLIHMHGELLKVRCQETDKVHSWKKDIHKDSVCPCCLKTANLRPHIVWFGEMPLQMARISTALRNCDVFISVGTSGNVYPAAGFVREVPPRSKKIEINLESTAITQTFDEHLLGLATERVPHFVKSLLEGSL